MNAFESTQRNADGTMPFPAIKLHHSWIEPDRRIESAKVRNEVVGRHISRKYRQRAADGGYHAAARQLRKQGFSLLMARLILLGTA